jgi:hypothetical protein
MDVENARSPAAPVAQRAFHHSMLDDLPRPVGRWLGHAIADGAPLCSTARIAMHGEIRIGAWRPFRAIQTLVPGVGFVWEASARLGPLRIAGFDRYADGVGEMRWRIARVLPVMSRAGPDISRSAAGRLAGETMLLPPAALGEGVTWEPVSFRASNADVRLPGEAVHHVTVEIDDAGSLRAIRFLRWGNPDGASYREHVFGVEVEREARFGDYVIPSRFSAGWWPGTDRWSEGEFFRAVIDDATFS